ncbi:MAG: hypothetical protein NZ455_09330 [Bacteroidia bacterium]|nr:hypothetical protein [Bacteroidia bacterium]
MPLGSAKRSAAPQRTQSAKCTDPSASEGHAQKINTSKHYLPIVKP